MQRKIIHCDCDCFYASIEIRDRPELSGRAVAVGGSPDRRGVVATCNYEARRFGIHSAMASSKARRLCPDLVILPPQMDKYRQASARMHDIFHDYTPAIEPLSLDEAYLDVTHSEACSGSATRIAEAIRKRVREEINITLSAGVAPNKFLAKIASDWNKPNGQLVITPAEVQDFVSSLSVKKLHGVGRVTAARLHRKGIRVCADLRRFSEEELLQDFGRFGSSLYRLCRGIDERPLRLDRVRKSLSVENTFAEDLADAEACRGQLPELHRALLRRLENIEGRYRITGRFVKVKFQDFVTTTVEQAGVDVNLESYYGLCDEGYRRGGRPVRLLGLGVKLTPLSAEAADPAATSAALPKQLGLELNTEL